MHYDFILDANVIIQYLVAEDEMQFQKSCEVMNHYRCYVTVQILCEVIYILLKRYEVPREEIVESLIELRELIEIENYDIFYEASQAFREKPKLDISDCILFAYKKLYNVSVFSFDKKLNKKIERLDLGDDSDD